MKRKVCKCAWQLCEALHVLNWWNCFIFSQIFHKLIFRLWFTSPLPNLLKRWFARECMCAHGEMVALQANASMKSYSFAKYESKFCSGIFEGWLKTPGRVYHRWTYVPCVTLWWTTCSTYLTLSQSNSQWGIQLYPVSVAETFEFVARRLRTNSI